MDYFRPVQRTDWTNRSHNYVHWGRARRLRPPRELVVSVIDDADLGTLSSFGRSPRLLRRPRTEVTVAADDDVPFDCDRGCPLANPWAVPSAVQDLAALPVDAVEHRCRSAGRGLGRTPRDPYDRFADAVCGRYERRGAAILDGVRVGHRWASDCGAPTGGHRDGIARGHSEAHEGGHGGAATW